MGRLVRWLYAEPGRGPDQTVLSGLIDELAALHGLLNTIRDLGLPLVEVLRLSPQASEAVDP